MRSSHAIWQLPSLRTPLMLATVMFLWAICYPLITIGLPLAPHVTFAALRSVIAGLILISLALALRRPMPRRVSTWRDLFIIGFGATTLGFLGMFHAAEFVSPGVATVIANTQPLFAAVLGHRLLGEHLGFSGKIGLAAGFFGIVTIALPHLVADPLNTTAVGVSYILLAAIGITVSNVLIKRSASDLDPIVAMGWQLFLGAIPLAMIVVTTEQPANLNWTATFLFSLIGLSVFGTAIAYWLWCLILQETPLNHANAYTFLVPVFGLAMGAIFFDETLTVTIGVGAALAVVGIWLVSRDVHGTVPPQGRPNDQPAR